uniref:Bestrophin homolog n=1 Tax=Daphnia galeata TaxID=27404 RepID=A0A8J2RS49_9CRUS|nr:unnamed protein product [Daphnia galeata]
MDKGASSNHIGIGRMLIMWRRSVYKVVYKELIAFLFLFGIISSIYRYALDDNQKKLMLTIQIYIPGDEEKVQELRNGLVRRALLMLILLLRSISSAVRRRFPTIQALVKEGIMTQKEKQCYESVFPVVNLFWIPATWFTLALNEAVKDGILTNESGSKLIMEEFLEFRASCGALWSYNWVSIPMIYTQVCTLSTYSYFIACLMARQYTGPSRRSLEDIDIVLPFGTIMELICYVGLLKVAEQIKNPFGDADEDFDLNFLITRHLRTVHLGLNFVGDVCPPGMEENNSEKDTTQPMDNLVLLMPGQISQDRPKSSSTPKTL